MIRQAIILAGGKGSRLQPVVSDVPKPMATVAGKPFLTYILDHLIQFNIHQVVLSTGYMHEAIQNYFGEQYHSAQLTYAVESTPLGTGGAIKKAALLLNDEPFFVVNGDTLYKINFKEFGDFHIRNKADISIALKRMVKPDRYGTVTLEGERITAFREKETGLDYGWINAGVYAMKPEVLRSIDEDVFSFEEKVLSQQKGEVSIMGWMTDGYFVDIGIPEDYEKANEDLKETGN